ncbi:MAG: right-handed parallel beta-helix repeat-containing protein, partial [Patescibacteria group bacterium]|nr:right-handed parallel beta-helix repeat-containing protein [Patescibacteria group bacterium]
GSRHSGYPDGPFTIVGNGATLDGSEPVPPEDWQHYQGAVFRFAPPRKEKAQLFLDGRPAPRVALEVHADHPPAMEPTQWCFLNGWIYFCVARDKIPDDYVLTYAHLPVGVTMYQVQRVAILDLTVQGFQLDGISAHNSARDVYLGGLTCRGNGRAGIVVGGASEVTLEGCLLGNNGEAQLLTLPYSFTRIRNCDLLGNTAPAWVDQGGDVLIDGEEARGGADEVAPPDRAANNANDNATDSKP